MTTVPVSPTIPSVPAAAVAPAATKAHAVSAERVTPYVWAVTRLMLGWTFLWPFLDKTFGLHHETPSAGAWIHGGSPTFFDASTIAVLVGAHLDLEAGGRHLRLRSRTPWERRLLGLCGLTPLIESSAGGEAS